MQRCVREEKGSSRWRGVIATSRKHVRIERN